MGGRAEGLACADPGARTPIGASGFFFAVVDLAGVACAQTHARACTSALGEISF